MIVPEVKTEEPMDQRCNEDWQELCKAAANESDPAKLIDLISELNKALDERANKWRNKSEQIMPDADFQPDPETSLCNQEKSSKTA
jgi:hypothetical protein